VGGSRVGLSCPLQQNHGSPMIPVAYCMESSALYGVAGRQAGATGTFQHPVHRGPRDREQLSQLGDRVLTTLVELTRWACWRALSFGCLPCHYAHDEEA
jgi:hypothetical protein